MEYVIEKLIDGEWYYEGKGDISYVNRILFHSVERKVVYRIKEVIN